MTGSAAMTDNLERRRRLKNWALLIVLAAVSLLFYFITMVRFGGQ